MWERKGSEGIHSRSHSRSNHRRSSHSRCEGGGVRAAWSDLVWSEINPARQGVLRVNQQ